MQKNVVKSLIAAEDILHGSGTVIQNRNGEQVTVHRVDIPVGVADLQNPDVDVSQYHRLSQGVNELVLIDGVYQQVQDLRPLVFGAGVRVTKEYPYVLSNGVLAKCIAALPYVIQPTDLPDLSDTTKWQRIGGSSTGSGSSGNGIEYTNVLPVQPVPERTYFDAESMALVFSYEDPDNTTHLHVPLLVGAGSFAYSGGGGGNSLPLVNAGVTADGFGFVLPATALNQPIKRIKAGTKGLIVLTETANNVTIEGLETVAATLPGGVTGASLVAAKTATSQPIKQLVAGTNVTLTDFGTHISIATTGGSGGGGNGIEYTNVLPASPQEGKTYFDAEAMALVYSYNDGDSIQYLNVPVLVGSGAYVFSNSGGGGGTTVINAGTAADGAGLVLPAVGGNTPIKRLKKGALNNIIITENANDLTIEALNVVNAGTTGFTLVNTKTATEVPVKRLVAGTNVTITDNTTHLTISATAGGGGATLGDALTRLNSLAPENNNVPVWTAAGVTQFLTTASTRAMMGLSTVANTIPMFTGTSSATLATLTPFMVTLLSMTGVPTALQHLKITSGSNSNGGWLRIGTGDTSGIQFCWHTLICNSATTAQGAGFVGPTAAWTYPQSFNGTPSVSASVQDGIQAWITNGASGNTASSASFRQQSFINGPGNAAVSVLAIGFY
ncbi:MAG: hypothetical protein ACRCSS_14210 [Shewanella sp.]